MLWDKRPVKVQVVSGLWITAKILLVWGTATILIGGIHVILSPPTNPAYFAGRHPYAFGALSIAIAMGIMVPTIKRWVTILPGLFGYGAFCSLIAIMTGSRMPRLHAAALTLVLIATAALLKSFVDRPLNLLDRIALLLFVSCIALSMTKDTFTMYLAWSVGLSFVLVAWLTNLIQVSRDYNVPLRPYDPAAHRTGRS